MDAGSTPQVFHLYAICMHVTGFYPGGTVYFFSLNRGKDGWEGAYSSCEQSEVEEKLAFA